MNKVNIEYEITRENEVILHDTATVGLTDKNIKEINEYIISDPEHATGELNDVPSGVYDRIHDSIVEDAIKKLSKKGGLYEDDLVNLQLYLPEEVINLLPEETLALLPADLFEEDAEDVVLDQFDMSVESYDNVEGKGIVFVGDINYGECAVGDDCLLLNEEDDIVAESKIIAILYHEKLQADLSNLNEDETKIGVLTRVADVETAENVYAIVIPQPE